MANIWYVSNNGLDFLVFRDGGQQLSESSSSRERGRQPKLLFTTLFWRAEFKQVCTTYYTESAVWKEGMSDKLSQNLCSQHSSGELSLNRFVFHIMPKMLCRKKECQINVQKTYFHSFGERS